MGSQSWSLAHDVQKRIIRELFAQVAQLSERIEKVEKGQIVDLKRLEKALGVPDDEDEG